jgi:chemotaxis protein methyltransferase CheR
MESALGQECTPLERLEISLLLEGIFQHYGYDFRNYSFPYLRRRIWHRIHSEDLRNVSELLGKVLRESSLMSRLFEDLSIHVTEMFRDPSFFLAFREQGIPLLRDLPNIRIWHAGCSTGEEVYSMAILLHEEGLLDKARIYATDINQSHLEKAKKGLFPLSRMQQYTKNYLQSGGAKAFSEYYSVRQSWVAFSTILSDAMVFSQHNLATDHSFNEFQVIICRNVLIYFNETLQQRVMRLFDSSLAPYGFLGLGSKEGLIHQIRYGDYETINAKEKIYRKGE